VKLRLLLSCALCACLRPSSGLAHNPDTSYARITISSNAVESRFTYDIVTLRLITEVDTDGDQRVSRAELQSRADVIHDYLRRNIYLEINAADARFGEALPPTWPEDTGEFIGQSDWHQRLISFTFRNPVPRTPTDVALVFDVFKDFNSRHTVLGVFVDGSTEHPVIFTRFEPDYLYDTTYEPAARPPPTATNAVETVTQRPPPTRRASEETAASRLARFLKLGVEHIFLGYDHILFLLGLIIVGKFWDLVRVVTSFTVAHTITLILATLELVSLPGALIETGIALTIVYVAAENLWKKEPKHRWLLTFAFGLVHGFGFANVLRELGLPQTGLMQSLLAFNLGVELGQLVIVAALWPLLWWMNQQAWSAKAKTGVSALLLAFGALWFVERAFGLEFMPI
jgi:hypothetical protein